MLEPQDSAAHPELPVGDPARRRAFAVADELAVHGAECVCPRCASRLPGLLAELARAIAATDDPSTDRPGTDRPGTDRPGTDRPGTDRPGTERPGNDRRRAA